MGDDRKDRLDRINRIDRLLDILKQTQSDIKRLDRYDERRYGDWIEKQDERGDRLIDR